MTNTAKKITKKDNFTVITAILNAAEEAGMSLEQFEGISYDSLKEFISHEVELLESKAAAAQKRAAAKKIEGDALREKIYEVLTDEAQSINSIVSAVNDPDVSAQMVTSRLTQLCDPKVGRAVKESIKVTLSDGKTKTVSGYRKA